MKTVIFLLIVLFFANKLYADDSIKVNVYCHTSLHTVLASPDVINHSNGNYGTKVLGLGYGNNYELSVFFLKNIGVEFSYQTAVVPTKIAINSSDLSADILLRSEDQYFTIGPTSKFMITERIKLNFTAGLLLSKPKDNLPNSFYYWGANETSYIAYSETIHYTNTNPNFIVKPTVSFNFTDWLSLKLSCLYRFSKTLLLSGNFLMYPDQPAQTYTFDFEQKLNYAAIGLGLELNMSSLIHKVIK